MDELKCGWLAPDGSFVECSYFTHHEYADNLVCKFGLSRLDGEGRYMNPDDILEKHGWCRISISLLGRKEWAIFWSMYKYLTEPQIQFLKPYFKHEFPVCFSAKMRWEREVANE